MSVIISPPKVYEVNGVVAPLQTIQIIAAGATNNQTVIAAVTGSHIRVMGWRCQANGAAISSINFKDGSGGTIKSIFNAPPNTNGDVDFLPVIDAGYFDCSLSTGLFVDIGTATGALITVFYIVYTP